MAGEALSRQLEAIETGWRRLRTAVEELGEGGMERRTAAGWTVKELVAHVAFWEETADPIINGMLRGEDVPTERWYGGDDLGVGPGDQWPESSVHNAREATWAAGRPAAEVMERWDRSHRRLLEIVATLGDDELADEAYLARLGATTADHYVEHLAELSALPPAG